MQLSEEDDRQKLSLTRFESMLKTNKVLFFDSEEFEDIILYYLDNGKLQMSKKALKLAKDQHPKSTGLMLVETEILLFENKIEIADKIINQLLELEPTNEEVYIQKATIFSKKNDHESAILFLKKALEFTDEKDDIYNLLGMEFLFMDKMEDAKQNFILCLEENPEDHTSLYNVIYCFEFLEQQASAIQFLDSFIDYNPYSEIAWHQKGRLHYSLKQYQEAYEAFEYATLIDETFVGAIMEKAKSLEKLGRFEEAIENYKATFEHDDPMSYAFLKIGKLYQKINQPEEALKFFYKTVHEDPQLGKGWTALTDFWVNEKNYLKALFYINKAIAIDENNPHFWKRYGNINKKMNFFEDAIIGYSKTIELGYMDLKCFLSWADILQYQGEFDTAISILNEALTFYPNNSHIEFRLVGLNYLIDEQTVAKIHLKNALKNKKSNFTILRELFPMIWSTKSFQKLIDKYFT